MTERVTDEQIAYWQSLEGAPGCGEIAYEDVLDAFMTERARADTADGDRIALRRNLMEAQRRLHGLRADQLKQSIMAAADLVAALDVAHERQRADSWMKLGRKYEEIRDWLRLCDDDPDGHTEFYRECCEVIFPDLSEAVHETTTGRLRRAERVVGLLWKSRRHWQERAFRYRWCNQSVAAERAEAGRWAAWFAAERDLVAQVLAVIKDGLIEANRLTEQERDTAEARIGAVRALHCPGHLASGYEYCRGCYDEHGNHNPWPCATAKAANIDTTKDQR